MVLVLVLYCTVLVTLAAKHGLIVSPAAAELAVEEEERSVNKQLLPFNQQLPRTWTQQNKLHRAKQRCFSKPLWIDGIVTFSLRQWDIEVKTRLFLKFQNMSNCPEEDCASQFYTLVEILHSRGSPVSKHVTLFRRIVLTGCASQLDALMNPQNIGLLVNGSIVGDASKAPF